MKCIGAANPPCARCYKAGRECISQRLSRGSSNHRDQVGQISDGRSSTGSLYHVFETSGASSISPYGQPLHFPSPVTWTPATPAPSALGSSSTFELSSVYSTSPFYAVVEDKGAAQPEERIHGEIDHSVRSKRQRIALSQQRTAALLDFPEITNQGLHEKAHPVSERDMTQLIRT